MIGFVKGKVIMKGDGVVVDTGGVGYRVLVSDSILNGVNEGDGVELYTWTHLRQNALDLYGCTSSEELEFFRMLQGMSGIGPNIALSLLKYGSPEKLKKKIERNGSQFVKEVKGVGKKKMGQLLLELTGKVKELGSTNDVQEEAVAALSNLGFSKKEARRVVVEIEADSSEKIVEEALKLIGDKK